ncbi:hypothetical protein CHS0354_038400 [Potamilus streckersoni]|uniref:Uncharacterized protein n=1 Tax=Potamilus streckersoni TaxID=2493646 RepID=A0AAE0VPJ9_9BIVA|nr:hypothetical protein CHS0354_038400 [Potamilus streckersoni]
MRSWEWPQNYRELGRVFASQCWEEEKLNDLPTYLEIIKSCREFKLPSTVLDQVQEIRQARNKYIGHNPSLRISENDKYRVFDMIKRFVSSAQISQEINSSLLLQVVHNIQMGKPFQRCPEQFNQVKKYEVNETKSIENGSHQHQEIAFNLKTQKNGILIVTKEVRGRKRKVALAGIFSIIFTFLTFANMFTRTGKDSLEGMKIVTKRGK